VPRLCKFYPGICLTTEGKARKNLIQDKKTLSQVKKNLSQVKKNLSQCKKNLSQVNKNLSQVKKTLSQFNRNLSQVKKTLSEVNKNLSQVKKTLSQGKKNLSQVKKKPQSEYCIHITIQPHIFKTTLKQDLFSGPVSVLSFHHAAMLSSCFFHSRISCFSILSHFISLSLFFLVTDGPQHPLVSSERVGGAQPTPYHFRKKERAPCIVRTR